MLYLQHYMHSFSPSPPPRLKVLLRYDCAQPPQSAACRLLRSSRAPARGIHRGCRAESPYI